MPASNLYSEFEQFVEELFRELSFEILEGPTPKNRDGGYDFVVRSKVGSIAVAEVKLHQSLKVAAATWSRTFAQLERARLKTGAERGLLITNAQLTPTMRADRPDHITVWDYDTLSFLAANKRKLAQTWERISQEGFIHRSEPLPSPQDRDPELVHLIAGRQHDSSPATDPPPKGADLCQELKNIKSGRGKNASQFEDKCLESLKYLFDGDLINWSPQKSSHGQLHRYDFIARISSENDFWNSLISDHRARYIIFECKNYEKPITQAEVYTTEKYLFPKAMRSTAIIISRKGANRNALRVIHGAFRETGKLILSIDLKQLCTMLHKRDNGDDPATVLSDVIEEMMIGLER